MKQSIQYFTTNGLRIGNNVVASDSLRSYIRIGFIDQDGENVIQSAEIITMGKKQTLTENLLADGPDVVRIRAAIEAALLVYLNLKREKLSDQ